MMETFDQPGPAVRPDTVLDRTMLLDPAALWPEPDKCPDWPYQSSNIRYEGPIGKAGAEARLEVIGQTLNRGPGKLRAPTTEERDELFAKTFKRPGDTWHHLGIRGLRPLGIGVENEAALIVEAAHIRAYLRKLEKHEAREVEAREARSQREARQALAEYRDTAPGDLAELAALAEAEARHRQVMDDERAFHRSRELRDRLNAIYSHAVTAAHRLGLGVPDAPFEP